MKSDIVVGLSYGDEGKGKVVYNLLKNGNSTLFNINFPNIIDLDNLMINNHYFNVIEEKDIDFDNQIYILTDINYIKPETIKTFSTQQFLNDYQYNTVLENKLSIFKIETSFKPMYFRNTNYYDVCVRFNGGSNAGHTIIHNEKEIIVHLIPIGILLGIKSIIASGCVINVKKLEEEIKYLEDNGFIVKENLSIAYNAHITTDQHIQSDNNTNMIGTTGMGIGPTYSDKYLRIGKRVKDYTDKENKFCGCNVIDPIEELVKYQNIMFEGAQGFYLDIDHGDYPYVTSSSCLASNAFSTGVPVHTVNNIYGVVKLYDTYVGTKEFQPDDIIFNKLNSLGKEIGATTGRLRQCNWLDIDKLEKAAYVNGITQLIINKCDIIEKLGVYKIISGGKIYEFKSLDDMKTFIKRSLIDYRFDIIFSSSPDII